MSLEQCLVDAIIDESVKTVFSTCHFLKLFPLGLCSPESEDFSLTSWKSSYTCWIISRFQALRFRGSIFRLLSSAFTMCVYFSSGLESMASLIWRRPKLKESKDFFPPFSIKVSQLLFTKIFCSWLERSFLDLDNNGTYGYLIRN